MANREPELVKMANEGTAFQWPDAPQEDKYSVCVHCGFCLEVCPTYQELADENHSPRGRVFLIKEASEGNLPLDDALIDPVFTCLDCRACETACPSGVQVGSLIEEARGQVHYGQPRTGLAGAIERLILQGIIPHPDRLKTLRRFLRFYQKSGFRALARKTGMLRALPNHLREMEAVIPAVSRYRAIDDLPEVLAPTGAKKASAALFTGCVMDVFFSDINCSTARVATRNGIEVFVPKDQICCGALQIHAGHRDEARNMARRNIDVFEAAGADFIAINAAGCGAALKEYPELFRDDAMYRAKAENFAAKIRDISELLVEVGFDPPNGEIHRRITYHDACHLCHAQHVRSQPRQLLQSIPGLELVEMTDSERCCGSAGIYNLTHPDMAGLLLERKMDDIPADVDGVVMGNPGCMMQIRAGVQRRRKALSVLHTVELLDEAYRLEREVQG